MIGDDAVIGGNVWITSSIYPNPNVTIVSSELCYKDLDPLKLPDPTFDKEVPCNEESVR